MRRIAFVFAILSLAGVVASAAPPPKKGKDQGALLVIDATDQVVGKLSTMGNTPVVYLTINGVLTSYFLAYVPQNGNDNFERVVPLSGPMQLLFSEPNCTGTAYMQNGDGTRAVARQAVVLKVDGQNYLYVGQPVAPTTTTLGSVFQTGGCAPTSGTAVAVPLNPPVNLSTMFAEPYRVE